MPQGQPLVVPDDGLTTKQRRNRPLVIVHTGDGKGKSTAAFGLALRGWNQGWSIGVFQFVKSAKWRLGEQSAFEQLPQESGTIEWHKMGSGWSWTRKNTKEDSPEHQAAADLYLLDEFTYPISWGWVDLDDVLQTLATRPGHQHVVITGRRADPRLVEAADLVTEMTKVKHPMDAGQKGQRGIEW